MTQEQKAIAIVQVVADVIRELGSVPSGHLYANLMGHMTLDTYQSIISILTRAKLIRVEHHVITWVG